MEKINIIFHKLCYEGKLKEAKQHYLDNSNVILDDDINYIFANCCLFGNLKIQKWLFRIKPNIKLLNNSMFTFNHAICNGHFKVTKWLVKMNLIMDISAIENGCGFDWACINGKLNILKWFLSVKPNIYNFNNNIIIWACQFGHLKVAKWLISVKPTINIPFSFYDFHYIKEKGHFKEVNYFSQQKPKQYYLFIGKGKTSECKVYCKKQQIVKLI